MSGYVESPRPAHARTHQDHRRWPPWRARRCRYRAVGEVIVRAPYSVIGAVWLLPIRGSVGQVLRGAFDCSPGLALKRGVQERNQRTQPPRRARLVAERDACAITRCLERQRVNRPEPGDRAFVHHLAIELNLHEFRACSHPQRTTRNDRLVLGTRGKPVTTDSSGRAHVGVPPMKLIHVGKLFEYNARRIVYLEVPRERNHSTDRTQVAAIMSGRELPGSRRGG
jgi:hypothetical protein